MRQLSKSRWNRVQNQIFVWAGDKPLQLKFSGFIFYVPPRTETAKRGPGSPYLFESAKDSNGRTIPGTIVVTDLLHTTPEGGYKKTFDVDACCRFLDRDRARLFEQGFQIVSEPGEIGIAMEESIPLWEQSEDRRAHEIIQSELARQEAFKAKGQEPPESSSAEQVKWAVQHLSRPGRRHAKPAFSTDSLKNVLSGKAPTAEAEPKKTPDEEIAAWADDHDAKIDMAGNMRLYQEAKDLGIKLTRTDLAGLLDNDPEMVELVAEKIKVKQEEGQAAAS